MADTQLVEYIGRQVNRVDDVLHTTRVWPMRGSVVEIPAKEVAFYLAHAKEWRVITPEEHASREVAREAASDNLDAVKAVWKDLTLEDLERIRDEIEAEIEVKRSAPVVEVEPVSGHAAPDASADDAASQGAQADRIQRIMAVIRDMDPNDDEQFTQNGSPRVPVVSDRVGFKASFDELGEAMELLNAG